MSDDKHSTKTDNVHEEHYCQHPGCKRWGSFGYDRGRGVTDWWCMEHRPDEAGGSR